MNAISTVRTPKRLTSKYSVSSITAVEILRKGRLMAIANLAPQEVINSITEELEAARKRCYLLQILKTGNASDINKIQIPVQ